MPRPGHRAELVLVAQVAQPLRRPPRRAGTAPALRGAHARGRLGPDGAPLELMHLAHRLITCPSSGWPSRFST